MRSGMKGLGVGVRQSDMPVALGRVFLGCGHLDSLKSGSEAAIHSNSPVKSIGVGGTAPHLSHTFVYKSQSDRCLFFYAFVDVHW